ncbi:hypothetical protein G3I34_02290 [Streptomyces sp. SID8014]|uniref:hypothetical protein n=1 Tax=Streptomyces sp. SID8014 TaxID=2706097 RepID=UPI0013B86B52|nr:hypothetical protein [Streptomyces sp. SID8014]NEC11158.1 hypothetical protein [Streptomyces sp. SID8014]
MQVLDWNDFDAPVKMAIQGGSTPAVLQTGGYAHKVADDLFQRAEEVLFPATPTVSSTPSPRPAGWTERGTAFDASPRPAC